jgi:CheY-like chemotaxis protein
MVAQDRVLIVDDDLEIRETLCELLRDEGYEVVGVRNGQEALDYLRGAEPPCLILLDLMMPVMDGLEFLAHWQKEPTSKASAVVILTASGIAHGSIQAAKEILPKPLRLETVLDAVERYC